MTDWQQQAYRPLEARGYSCLLTWNGRALTIARGLGGFLDVTVPARQVASIAVIPLSLEFTVTTTAGTRYRLRYWPWQGASFRAFRDAVLDGIAALG